jgi:hypothetical protein
LAAKMLYTFLADLTLLLHLAFVLFVVLGGLLVLRWRRLMWVHLIAVCWGVIVELAGFICPITPLEVALRQQGGAAGYEGGFIDHYVGRLLYPAGLTREVQLWLALAVLLPNILIYAYIFRRAEIFRRLRLR